MLKVGTKPAKIENMVTDYKYINAGTVHSGYVTTYNCLGDTVTTPSRGQGGIGYVGYQSEAFWLGTLCYQIRSNSDWILTKYLFYYLSSYNWKITNLKKEGGVPAINKYDLANISVSIPSFTEQKQIVSILDRFNKLCNGISEGLPAEIEARQKQYEYYRDKLLGFERN